MRDLLTELFQGAPPNPIDAAAQPVRPRTTRRFYKLVTVGAVGEGFSLLLDGQTVRTPGRQILAVPTKPLADILAAEWERQGEHLNPAAMPLTRLVNSILDMGETAPVATKIAKYLGSDLLFYRAATPHGLVARQAELWDPIIDWAGHVLGASFTVTKGVIFVAQPERALVAARAAVPEDPWRLGAVHSMTTLTGSALLALAVLRRQLGVEAAWTAAHVDEDWNMATWGRDPLTLQRRTGHRTEMQAAAWLVEAVRT